MITIFDHTVLLCVEMDGYIEIIDLKTKSQAKHIKIENCTQINDIA
jgi:hypothetical protein